MFYERNNLMPKTYVPTLRVVAASTYRYMTRWQPKLEANMTEDQITCLVNAIAAVLALIQCLGAAPIEP
jgi:hypothetical protein